MGDVCAGRQGSGSTSKPYVVRNDAYTFFRTTGDLLVTGPTDTNVMDVRVMFSSSDP